LKDLDELLKRADRADSDKVPKFAGPIRPPRRPPRGFSNIAIEISEQLLLDMDKLSQNEGFKTEEIIIELIQAYTYGNPDIDIDTKDKIYFSVNFTSHYKDEHIDRSNFKNYKIRKKDLKSHILHYKDKAKISVSIEMKNKFFEEMKKLSNEINLSPEKIVENLMQSYTYGDKEVYIDEHDRICFPPRKNNEMKTMEIKISELYNLLNKYNPKLVNNDLIAYCNAINDYTENIIDFLDALQDQNEEKINLIKKTNIKILEFEISHANEAYEERKNLLRKTSNFDLEKLYKILFETKKYAKDIEKEIGAFVFNLEFEELNKLEKEERPSFTIIAKGIEREIIKKINKFNDFNSLIPVIKKLFGIHKKWSLNYQEFINNKNNFINKCVEDSIEKEIAEKWHQEWDKEIIGLEYKLNKLFISCIDKKIDLQTLEELEENLNDYKVQIDRFFKNNRKSIYQEFAFETAGSLKEKFKVKKKSFKLLSDFLDNTDTILNEIRNHESKKFLLTWINSWYNNEINTSLGLIEKEEYQEIFMNILSEIRAMRENNFKAFYNDIQEFTRNRKAREEEYNKLLFKMQKEINKN